MYRMPILNCIYLSIIEVYKSYGVEPSFTLPYCVGHELAFYASGMETLEDAQRHSVSLTSNYKDILYGTGRIFIAQIGRDKMENIILYLGLTDEVYIVEASTSVHCLVSGTIQGFEKLTKALDHHKITYFNNNQAIAWHTKYVDAIVDHSNKAHEATLMPPKAPIYISSKQIDHTNYKDFSSREFWGSMLREEIRFNDAVKLVLEKEPDCDVFLEIAPYHVIGGILRRTLYEKGKVNHMVLPSMMHPSENNFDTLFSTLAKLSVGGYPVKWDVAYPHGKHTVVQGYACQ
eukprot:gene11631-13581_t